MDSWNVGPDRQNRISVRNDGGCPNSPPERRSGCVQTARRLQASPILGWGFPYTERAGTVSRHAATGNSRQRKKAHPTSKGVPGLAVASQSVQESTAVQLLWYGRGHRSGSAPVSGMELPVFPHVHPANACGRRDASQLSPPRRPTHAGTTPTIPARPPPVVHAE